MYKLYILLLVVIFIVVSCHKKDLTEPTITLVGNTNIQIPLNSTWSDPGYTAHDNQDEDISESVVVGGKINTNLAGIYKLTYTVSDFAGNEASVIRTVIVYNEAGFLSGKYTAKDSTSTSTTISYNSTIVTSTTKNKEFYIQNFGGWNLKCNCYTSIKLEISDTLQGSSISWDKQLIYGKDSLNSSPGGVITSTSPSSIRITYSWFNTTTQQACTGLYTKE